ncbi:MAG: hypothetical protein BLM47_00040 [Candidatus Reconcilbacillus cellulovorans]|uniref:DUF2612 domain-containing protein n=1 Tax=Candidatus Reconcilbacillus cellulovorans TaxID=1906605 RepID=A0A2A6E417_9BACL|nr:MAG: hypothetical protein BLM47_00040 [Candidatus Reconcilbacillus cellulovorans]
MITVQDMLRRLTDVFRKDPDSNIGKLMAIFAEQLQKLEQTVQRVEEWRDIDKAEGTTLDRIGENVGQPRGVATDEIYRILIKSKIARNLSKGDINTIITVLATALNTDPSEIRIVEMYNDPIAPEPATISIIQLPLKRINEVGMDPTQFARIVQRTVAAGVRVGVIELVGTFEYGSIGDPPDPERGFADINQTFGGTLGAAYSPGNVPDLPI